MGSLCLPIKHKPPEGNIEPPITSQEVTEKAIQSFNPDILTDWDLNILATFTSIRWSRFMSLICSDICDQFAAFWKVVSTPKWPYKSRPNEGDNYINDPIQKLLIDLGTTTA